MRILKLSKIKIKIQRWGKSNWSCRLSPKGTYRSSWSQGSPVLLFQASSAYLSRRLQWGRWVRITARVRLLERSSTQVLKGKRLKTPAIFLSWTWSKRIKENCRSLRSLNTHDIPGAYSNSKEIAHPTNIMSTDDIEGAKPSRFRHRKWDRKKIIIDAKYNNWFDEFGNRREESPPSQERKVDPLAGSKERRKTELSGNKFKESDYSPVFIKEWRPSRRHFKGVYK